MINETILKSLCPCSDCLSVYSKLVKHVHAESNLSEEDKRLQKNLDGIVDGEDEDGSEGEKKQNKNEASSSSSARGSPEKAAMDKLTDESYLIGMMAKSMR